jgi:hypothetical protein
MRPQEKRGIFRKAYEGTGLRGISPVASEKSLLLDVTAGNHAVFVRLFNRKTLTLGR